MAIKTHDKQHHTTLKLENIGKKICNVIKKHIIFIGMLILSALNLLITYYSTYIASAISIRELRVMLIFAFVFTIALFSFAILIICLTYREMRPNINQEVMDSVDQKLQCQICMSEMFEIQKRLYNVELENFVQSLSVDDIKKINLLVCSLSEKGAMINETNVAKIQTLVNILLRAKESNKFAAYITLADMKTIESQVEDKSAIHIISSSIFCDNELGSTIMNNLKRGVKYYYYFPRNKQVDISRDTKFKELVSQFNDNIELWKSDALITNETIQQQISCCWFPEEYMQMSITFYDYQRFAVGSKPTIVVKFPAVSDDVILDYPLFFYINRGCSINDSFCKVLDFISNSSKEGCFREIPSSKKIEMHFD